MDGGSVRAGRYVLTRPKHRPDFRAELDAERRRARFWAAYEAQFAALRQEAIEAEWRERVTATNTMTGQTSGA
jgi:hypothetical protein